MAAKRDYYEVLGVPKDADDAALKKAYRNLAKQYHPDTNPGNEEAEVKFKEASEAYGVLSDTEKRRQYDQFGHSAFDGAGGAGGFSGFEGFDFDFDLGDILGGFFGGGRSGSRGNSGPRQGASIKTGVRITFEEAVFGVDKEIELTLKDECGTCHGTGGKPGSGTTTCTKCNGQGQVIYLQQSLFGEQIRTARTCPDCNGKGKIIKEKCTSCYGSGYISNRKKIQVTIPAGIDNGQSIRIRGKGEPGVNGGERGDLLVEVLVSNHPIFKRQDSSIFSTVPISFATAALGGEIRVKTIDGEVLYDVKAGTQTDTKVRLKGKGVPSLRSKSIRGDHYVTLVVKTPEKLNEEQKEALRNFDALFTGVPPTPSEGGKSKRKKGIFK